MQIRITIRLVPRRLGVGSQCGDASDKSGPTACVMAMEDSAPQNGKERTSFGISGKIQFGCKWFHVREWIYEYDFLVNRSCRNVIAGILRIPYPVVMIELREFCKKGGFSMPQLCAFMEVAEAGGIAKAVSATSRQSLYSRQIGELEKFFGLQLFQNRGKTMVLTDAGEELVRVAREALIGLFDFNEACGKRPSRFTIGGGAALLNGLVAPKVCSLFGLGHSVSISLRNLRNREVIAGLHDLSLDFGLVKEPSIPSGLDGERLGEMDYALYVPKRLIPKGTELTWSWAIGNLPIACQGTEGEALSKKLEESSIKGLPRLRFAVQSDTYVAVIRVLASESFAAILPTIMSAELKEDHFVALRTETLDDFSRPVFLLWNRRTLHLRGTRAEAIKDCLSEILAFNPSETVTERARRGTARATAKNRGHMRK